MNSDYIVAVHALVFLHHNDRLLSSEELSKNICTHPARVRKVLSKLAKAGLVISRRGTCGGGYQIYRNKPLSLDKVAKIFGDNFVQTPWFSGDESANCPICSGMADYIQKLYKKMNEACQRELEKVTIDDIEKQLVKKESEDISKKEEK